MIIVLKKDAGDIGSGQLRSFIEERNACVSSLDASGRRVFDVSGDVSGIDAAYIESLSFVESVVRTDEPFRYSGKTGHPEPTVIEVGRVRIGEGFTVIAGPCSVESQAQILGIAAAVRQSGADILRGGAFKPRTSPYVFQGLGAEGLRLLRLARVETGMPLISEIMSPEQLPLFDGVDILQVGARNMQNYELLRALGKADKPVLLKRGWGSTLKELLMSAEYVMSGGNERVILCERGIRSFETSTRATLDLSAVPVLKELSHLPVIVDPSHAAGRAAYVPSLALAAAAAGADGIMLEVHDDPSRALSDGAQSVTPEQLAEISVRARLIRQLIG